MLLKATMTSLLLSFVLAADPINVSYTVTGGPGDWTLDFSVNNNISGAANQDVYFFGVDLSSSSNINGSPSFFSAFFPVNLSGSFGGANITYNDTWLDSSEGSDGLALPGTTTSGFDVMISDATAPTSVDWAAVTFGLDPYSGSGNLDTLLADSAENPLFEGAASPTPEPSTLIFLGAGLAGIVGLRRRKKVTR